MRREDKLDNNHHQVHIGYRLYTVVILFKNQMNENAYLDVEIIILEKYLIGIVAILKKEVYRIQREFIDNI